MQNSKNEELESWVAHGLPHRFAVTPEGDIVTEVQLTVGEPWQVMSNDCYEDCLIPDEEAPLDCS
jgi:hypothetical protein